MSIKLIVGLGNPGRAHIYDRHNIGFMIIDYMANKFKFKMFNHRDFSIGRKKILGKEIHFLKPLTYMNLSGLAVKQYIEKKEILPQEVLVITDDFNINLGIIRVRQRGSSGGHNGLGSVIEWLKTEYIPRVRIGIGPIPDGVKPEDFVLDKFSRNELPVVTKIKEKMVTILRNIIKNGVENITIDITKEEVKKETKD
ncbi:MAG: aminoacyl-tRNA hydrolase [Elusimicrobiota bacterium]|nr:aminoacyl-tRNA hydrolase [Endomicrobiia bacterium]MDW8165916.1 aminoacyl-tRNA hydrolase [Elusimicrobiota bacterium]